MNQATAALAAFVLCAAAPASAQTMVTLYGTVDAAMRHTSNEGPVGQASRSRTAMAGGGLSTSKWGVYGIEDLGGGNQIHFNLEQGFQTQSGALAVTGADFQQSWVALHSPRYGRITLGRNYHALFELYAITFAAYPYLPLYFDAYKPEVGMAAGGRSNELLKYSHTLGNFRVHLETTLRGEQHVAVPGLPGSYSVGGKARAGFVRWGEGGLALGAGYLQRSFGTPGKHLRAAVLGGSYRTGPWYFTSHYGVNRHNLTPQSACGEAVQCWVDDAVLGAFWGDHNSGGFRGPAFTAANQRRMLSLGVARQMSPALNLSLNYWYARQSGREAGVKANAHFVSLTAHYALSKRSALYAEADYTRLNGQQVSLTDTSGQPNGKQQRAGVTVGFRHSF